MKKLMKNYFLFAGLLIASVFNFVSCSGDVPTDNTIRLELNSSNYNDFNDEEIMSQYIGKEIYIHADETFTSDMFRDIFSDGAYKNFSGWNYELNKWDSIYATLDLSEVKFDNCSYLCGNVSKLILPVDFYYIDIYNASNLEEIIIPAENEDLTAIDGIMYDKDVTKIYGFPRAKKIDKYVIPSTITTLVGSQIHQPKFDVTKEVVVHENFNEFASFSFYYFSGLERVVLKCKEPPVMNFNITYNEAALKKCSPDIKFYVPKGCKGAYETAWADWYSHAGYDGDLADRIVESD